MRHQLQICHAIGFIKWFPRIIRTNQAPNISNKGFTGIGIDKFFFHLIGGITDVIHKFPSLINCHMIWQIQTGNNLRPFN